MLRLGELCWRDFRLLAGRRAGAEEVAGHGREGGGGGLFERGEAILSR